MPVQGYAISQRATSLAVITSALTSQRRKKHFYTICRLVHSKNEQDHIIRQNKAAIAVLNQAEDLLIEPNERR